MLDDISLMRSDGQKLNIILFCYIYSIHHTYTFLLTLFLEPSSSQKYNNDGVDLLNISADVSLPSMVDSVPSCIKDDQPDLKKNVMNV